MDRSLLVGLVALGGVGAFVVNRTSATSTMPVCPAPPPCPDPTQAQCSSLYPPAAAAAPTAQQCDAADPCPPPQPCEACPVCSPPPSWQGGAVSGSTMTAFDYYGPGGGVGSCEIADITNGRGLTHGATCATIQSLNGGRQFFSAGTPVRFA